VIARFIGASASTTARYGRSDGGSAEVDKTPRPREHGLDDVGAEAFGDEVEHCDARRMGQPGVIAESVSPPPTPVLVGFTPGADCGAPILVQQFTSTTPHGIQDRGDRR
jgi:hypothetical protein